MHLNPRPKPMLRPPSLRRVLKNQRWHAEFSQGAAQYVPPGAIDIEIDEHQGVSTNVRTGNRKLGGGNTGGHNHDHLPVCSGPGVSDRIAQASADDPIVLGELARVELVES